MEGHDAPWLWYLNDYKLWQTQTEISSGHMHFCKLAFFTGPNDYITNNDMLLEDWLSHSVAMNSYGLYFAKDIPQGNKFEIK